MKTYMSELNILFISSWTPAHNDLFNGNFVIKHAEAVSLNARVFFLDISNDPVSDWTAHCSRESNNLKVIHVSLNSLNPIVRFFRKWIAIFFYIQKFVFIWFKYGKPDVVHANVAMFSGFYALLYKAIFGVPYVLSEHWTGYLDNRIEQLSSLKRKLVATILKHADFVCPVSESLSLKMKIRFPEANYCVVPNVVDVELFSLDAAQTSTSSVFQFVHISTLKDDHKNISGILEAVGKLKEQRTDFVLHIASCMPVGEWADRAHRMGISAFVVFHESLTSRQISSLLHRSNAMVLFSNYETFGVVVVEAFACGLPVIGTRIPALEELIGSDCGILVDVGDVEALMAAMQLLIVRRGSFKPSVIRSRVVQAFSYSAVSAKFIRLYSQMIKSR